MPGQLPDTPSTGLFLPELPHALSCLPDIKRAAPSVRNASFPPLLGQVVLTPQFSLGRGVPRLGIGGRPYALFCDSLFPLCLPHRTGSSGGHRESPGPHSHILGPAPSMY